MDAIKGRGSDAVRQLPLKISIFYFHIYFPYKEDKAYLESKIYLSLAYLLKEILEGLGPIITIPFHLFHPIQDIALSELIIHPIDTSNELR